MQAQRAVCTSGSYKQLPGLQAADPWASESWTYLTHGTTGVARGIRRAESDRPWRN